MRRTLLAALAACLAATPATAVEIVTAKPTGGSISLTVDASFRTCGSVTLPGSTAFAGEMTAIGVLQGPGTQLGTVRATVPVAGVGTWSHCIHGAYYGATVGDGKFGLTLSWSEGDYVNVQQCVVNRGVVTCV